MKFKYIFFILLFFPLNSHAESFNEIVQLLNNHPTIKAIKYEQKATDFEGKYKSSWEDPHIRVDALNFPSREPEFGVTPMSGIQTTISQKVPLSRKYKNIKKSYNSKTKALQFSENAIKRNFTYQVWQNAIQKEKLQQEIKIYNDNIKWINLMINVSNKLYITGEISQQSILDLKIRKSEIKINIETRNINLKKLKIELAEIINQPNRNIDISLKSVPWNILNNYKSVVYKELPEESIYKYSKESARFNSRAQKSNIISDVTVGVNYRHRNEADNAGDFVGAFISLPLPVRSKKYSNYKAANERYNVSKENLINYQNNSKSRQLKIKNEIQKMQKELSILEKETISFATISRNIVSKRYRVGKSNYIELIKSELQLQNLLLKKVNLKSKLKEKKLTYLFEMGANIVLYNGEQK